MSSRCNLKPCRGNFLAAQKVWLLTASASYGKSTHTGIKPQSISVSCDDEIAGPAGERIAPSSTHRTRVSWTSRYWERTSSCTLRRDAARERAYESLRGNPRWRPWGPTRRTPRKVRNTLTTHSTEWAVRVFHSLTKQATCYTKFEYIHRKREQVTLLFAPRYFQRSDTVPWKSMNSERNQSDESCSSFSR